VPIDAIVQEIDSEIERLTTAPRSRNQRGCSQPSCAFVRFHHQAGIRAGILRQDRASQRRVLSRNHSFTARYDIRGNVVNAAAGIGCADVVRDTAPQLGNAGCPAERGKSCCSRNRQRSGFGDRASREYPTLSRQSEAAGRELGNSAAHCCCRDKPCCSSKAARSGSARIGSIVKESSEIGRRTTPASNSPARIGRSCSIVKTLLNVSFHSCRQDRTQAR
jgi:hypothetical protein